MKRTLYSFLLIFLLSCGTRPAEENIVAVHLNNGEIHDGVLLYVRDRSVLLQEQLHLQDSSLSTIVNIPTSNIHSVEIIRPSNWEAPVFGGLFGGALGCGAATLVKADRSNEGYLNFGELERGMIGFAIGAGLGIVAGVVIDNIPETISPENPSKWKRLHLYAKFPNEEPDELKKIQ